MRNVIRYGILFLIAVGSYLGYVNMAETPPPKDVSSDPACNICIQGETSVPRDTLVRLKAGGDLAGAKNGLIWRVSPSAGVSRATSPRGLLEWVAPPGRYDVTLLGVAVADGSVQLDEATVTVTIGGTPPAPPAPPGPPPAPPGPPKERAQKALGRIQFGTAGCTATVVTPRRPDGRWDVLTAAHCTPSAVGASGVMTLKDGRKIAVSVTARETSSDICWLVTSQSDITDMPTADIASATPSPGTKVWHAGYGVDKPANIEEGTVTGGPDKYGQVTFNLSVSSGDSGGGIFRADTDEWVGAVCCTTILGGKGPMYAGGVEAAKRLRPVKTAD